MKSDETLVAALSFLLGKQEVEFQLLVELRQHLGLPRNDEVLEKRLKIAREKWAAILSKSDDHEMRQTPEDWEGRIGNY